MSNVTVCQIDPELLAAIKKFKMRTANTIAAKFLKINKADLTVILDEEFEDITIDELRDELPNQQPRFIALSYKYEHKDGRVSYPFILVFLSPQGCSPELQMMYAGSKLEVTKKCDFTKVIEIRSADDFTVEAVEECISKY